MAYPIARHIFSRYLLGRITHAQGTEYIPKDQGVLFVANHVGWHDPLLTVFYLVTKTGYKKVHSLTEWALFEKPVLGKWMGAIPVMKDKHGALNRASEYLRSGKNILIYPQGHVDNSDTISEAKTGAARLALLSKCPAVPIGLTRMEPAQTRTLKKFKEIFAGKISINIGAPIDLSEFYEKEVTRELLYGVTNSIMSKVADLSHKKYIPRDIHSV